MDVFEHPRIPMTLKIAGRGPLEEDVKRVAGKSIEYLGFIDGKTKQDYLRHATALVMPSECYENFPLAIMEANACGTPALVSRLGGLAEMVQSGENGSSFLPRDANAFWEALKTISEGKDPSSHRGRCQAYAQKSFSKQRFLAERRLIYEPKE